MKRYITTILLMVLALTACDGGESTPAPVTETPAPVTQTPLPGPTDTPAGYPAPPTRTPTPDGYPAPPTPTPLPDGYPAPAAPEDADPDAYPAGPQLLISRPLGTQCTDPSTFEYASLDEAVNALTSAGVRVFSARLVNRMVCEACSCPTSAHFEMIIHPDDAALATGMGWSAEGEP